MKVSAAVVFAVPALSSIVVRQDMPMGTATVTLSSVASATATAMGSNMLPSSSPYSIPAISTESGVPPPSFSTTIMSTGLATILPVNGTVPTTTMIVPPFSSANGTGMGNTTVMGMPGTGSMPPTMMMPPPQTTMTVNGGSGGSGGSTGTGSGSGSPTASSVMHSGATVNAVSLLGVVAGLAAFML